MWPRAPPIRIVVIVRLGNSSDDDDEVDVVSESIAFDDVVTNDDDLGLDAAETIDASVREGRFGSIGIRGDGLSWRSEEIKKRIQGRSEPFLVRLQKSSKLRLSGGRNDTSLC